MMMKAKIQHSGSSATKLIGNGKKFETAYDVQRRRKASVGRTKQAKLLKESSSRKSLLLYFQHLVLLVVY